MNLDSILEKLGIKSYELATEEEQATLNRGMKQLESKSVGMAEIRQNISDMKAAVEDALASEKHDKRQDVYLKARLRNHLMLEAF